MSQNQIEKMQMFFLKNSISILRNDLMLLFSFNLIGIILSSWTTYMMAKPMKESNSNFFNICP